MYGVQGSTWVALGDPVGPPERLAARLVQQFLERCDDFDGTPVFYEVGKERLSVYADFGLTFVKLGEQARVDRSRLQRRRGRPARPPPGAAAAREGRLRVPRGTGGGDPASCCDGFEAVSKTGYAAGRRREGRSPSASSIVVPGQRFPVAVVERSGRLEAFANLWPGAGHGRALDRPDALPRVGAQERDGVAARPPDALGEGAGLPLVRARHGALVGPRALAGGAALGAAGLLRLQARRGALQLPGTARLQGEVPPDLGAALPGLSRRSARCRASWPTSRPCRRRLRQELLVRARGDLTDSARRCPLPRSSAPAAESSGGRQFRAKARVRGRTRTSAGPTRSSAAPACLAVWDNPLRARRL